eukprot:767308-Hanusia_phi.AAC.2
MNSPPEALNPGRALRHPDRARGAATTLSRRRTESLSLGQRYSRARDSAAKCCPTIPTPGTAILQAAARGTRKIGPRGGSGPVQWDGRAAPRHDLLTLGSLLGARVGSDSSTRVRV